MLKQKLNKKYNLAGMPIKGTHLAIMGMFLMLLLFRQNYINPPHTMVEVGCSNECGFGYVQTPYPECDCVLNDQDEDGFADLDEIDAGTNPLDPFDFPGDI